MDSVLCSSLLFVGDDTIQSGSYDVYRVLGFVHIAIVKMYEIKTI